jgi:hypothetical protein
LEIGNSSNRQLPISHRIFRGPAGYRQLLEAWTAAKPNVSVID